MINPELDIKSIKEEFKKNKIVIINNIFTEDNYNNIHNYFYEFKKKPSNWFITFSYYNKKKDIKLQKLTMNEYIYYKKKVKKSFINNNFSFLFYRFNEHVHKCTCYKCFLIKYFKSNKFINFLNNIVDNNITISNTVFVTKYTKDCFLSIHTDKRNGKYAFIYNITKYWDPQYGGLLHILEDNRIDIKKVIYPKKNSFVLFEVPENEGIPHFVSQINPNINLSRISMTGWYS